MTLPMGCTTALEVLNRDASIDGDLHFTNDDGESSASVFDASSNKAPGGWGIAKMWCLQRHAIDGSVRRLPSGCADATTEARAFASTRMAKVLALQSLAEECGLENVTVRHWKERIRSVHPDRLRGRGVKIDTEALMMERAPGVSSQLLGWLGSTPWRPGALDGDGAPGRTRADDALTPDVLRHRLDAFRRVASERVVEAAIFDVLFRECDRNPSNVLIDGGGRLALIDHDQALGGSVNRQGWASNTLNLIYTFPTNCVQPFAF